MNDLTALIEDYLTFCTAQKRLNEKTIKAYRIDLRQFQDFFPQISISAISPDHLESYIAMLHSIYKAKTAKRKIASLKAFYHYLEYRDLIEINPFNKLQIHFREPLLLPKTIPLHDIEKILSAIYHQHQSADTDYQRKNALRDAAVIEFLFATGSRISELCELTPDHIDLQDGTVLIYGKGSKERCLQIGNRQVKQILTRYYDSFSKEIHACDHFFVNQSGHPFSDQAVRRMINKYASLAGITLHITPHMFRHTFATSLLEADVDIRYIQKMLGHSSINITEIYTHVSMAKQKEILTSKHPRKDMQVQMEI